MTKQKNMITIVIRGGNHMKTLVWGHRGASGEMPENTLPSFLKAAEEGADGIELDIQLSKDGEIVVCHDETIDRTSDHTGFVKDYTLKELKSFNFNKTHPEYGHAELPTMKEVFDALKDTGLSINIELKTGMFDYEGIEEKIIALTQEEGYEDRVIYSSFNHYSIKRIQALDPHAKTAFLYSDGNMDMPEYGKKNEVDALHPWFYNLRFDGYMEACRKYGLDVNVWTVNTEEDIRACIRYGVNAIIGNYPALIRKVIKEYE